MVILRLAFGQAEPPAVIMDHDGDVIRVVEGRCRAFEGGVVKIPFRRRELPNQLRELTPVFIVSGAAALRRKIILVPPLKLVLWRQGYLAGLLVADEITADGNKALQRSGQRAAMMLAVRAPQSKPAMIAFLDVAGHPSEQWHPRPAPTAVRCEGFHWKESAWRRSRADRERSRGSLPRPAPG